MRYRLRTLLILLAVGPPLAAWTYSEVEEHLRYRRQQIERNDPRRFVNGQVLLFRSRLPSANSSLRDASPLP